MHYEKYEKDGEVAVLYSKGYGLGWSTGFNYGIREGLIFDREIVQAVLDGAFYLAAKIAETKYNADPDGVHTLAVKFLPKGTAFLIKEYDGKESIVLFDKLKPYVA